MLRQAARCRVQKKPLYFLGPQIQNSTKPNAGTVEADSWGDNAGSASISGSWTSGFSSLQCKFYYSDGTSSNQGALGAVNHNFAGSGARTDVSGHTTAQTVAVEVTGTDFDGNNLGVVLRIYFNTVIGFTDSFTRPNSSGLSNNWINALTSGGTWGVVSNKAAITATGSGVSSALAVKNTNKTTAFDFTVTVSRSSTSGSSRIYVCHDASNSDQVGIAYGFDSSSGYGYFQWGANTSASTFGPGTAFTGGSATIRLTYVPSTGVVNMYFNGATTPTQTITITAGARPTPASYVGIHDNNSGSYIQFDDAVAA